MHLMDTSTSTPQGRGTRPTLEMVAALAGVSRGTASRVLSGASNVSPRAIESVRKAAAELNYRPNLAARSLVTGRTGLVGLLVNKDSDRLWSDPFHQRIAQGAHTVLSKSGVALVLSMTEHGVARDLLLDLVTTRLDGVLLVRGPGDEDLVADIVATGIPCCVAGNPGPLLEGKVCWVGFDNDTAARSAVSHLVDRGRRTIGIISGPPDNSASVERVEGWRAQLAEAGLEHGDDLVGYGDWGIAAGAEAAGRLLAERPDIDALFCANDLMAAGAVRYAHGHGRKVPDDLSVIGFGDLTGENMEPPLTTVRADVTLMGERMADLLLQCLGGCRGCTEVLPTELVVRGTT
jgi:DNA-binding LacI/PurR family transcriptional regulator